MELSPISSNSAQIAAYSPDLALNEQKESEAAIAMTIVAKWIEMETIILKAPKIEGRDKSREELDRITKMMRRHQDFTPKDFGEAIRLAADEKVKELAAHGGFPRLYYPDIEEQLLEIGKRKLRERESQVLHLPANVGGNQFWGKPSEALAREWPKIAAQTKLLRQTIGVNLRDRFWYGGSAEQQQSAKSMLRQMVIEMNDAGAWDLRQNQWEALAIWQREFCTAFPTFGNLIDGMKCPICPLQVDEIRRKVTRIAPNGDFPDIDDAKFCAVFDAYWNFKNEK